MKIFLLAILFATLAATGTHRARADETKTAPIAARTPAITWKDSESRNTIFTSDDVLFFDWDKQYFLLKDAAFDRYSHWLTAPELFPEKDVRVPKTMDIEDRNGLIYRWDSFISAPSFSDTGPHYIAKYNLRIDRKPIVITSGEYPDRQGRSWIVWDDKPVPHALPLAERLYNAWQAAGVFKPNEWIIRPGENKISASQIQWMRVGPDAHVGIECNGEDFVVGRQPRAEFLFATDEKFAQKWDALAIEIRYVANDGQFRSDTRIENIAPQTLNERVYRCQLPPWKPVEGSQPKVGSGIGSIACSLLFQQRKNGQLVTTQRVEFDAFALTARSLYPRY